jgi:hypothetical protein
MARSVAILWHASFSIAAGILYFFFVLPRWPELMGDTSHTLGTTLRIVAGALVALAALPVVFTLLRSRKPELGTPQLALSIRVCSIVAHVLAGGLIVGTAISEHWVSLDTAGRWLFGIYGGAAAVGVLGIFAFYLSFIAELPPPPPKPIKPKKAQQPKKRGLRGKKGDETEDVAEEVTEEATEEAPAATAEADTGATEEPTEGAAEEAAEPTEEAGGGLQNRRPTGKGPHRMRRRRTRGGVALDE